MTIADKARDAAIHCEMKKVSYRQTKDGIVISFVLHPQEVPAALSTSHIGARYIAALVEIGDDEQPINPAAKETKPVSPATPRPVTPDKPLVEAKRTWESFQPSQQAGIRSHDPHFAIFLEEEYPDEWQEGSVDAATCIRSICGVKSRSEFVTSHSKRVLWNQLDKHFQAWSAKIRMNA